MIRNRRALLASLLLAAVALPSPAYALSLSGLFAWFNPPCRDGVCGIDIRPR